MKHLKIKPLLIAMSLNCVSATALAQLYSPNLNVNSINGDNVTATVSFPAPVTGDLYVATFIAGTWYFVGKNAVLSTTPLAFQKNSRFTSTPITVLDIPSAGIPAGSYSLFQVVTVPNANVMDYNNWIGKLNGLSEIKFSINLDNNPPVDNVATGQAKYKSLGCADRGCHTANPAANKNKLLNGKSLASLKAAINKNASDMGYLRDPTNLQFASDADLQAIANYLQTF